MNNIMISNNYLNIIVSSAAVYIFIVLAIRFFGKKELSQLSVMDLVFMLLISNAVQNAMVGPDSTLQGGLLAALTLFILNYLFKYFIFRSSWFSELIEGEPVILISNGRIHEKSLQKEHIPVNELLEAVREHGLAGVHEVNLAILEIDGNISILSDDYKNRSVRTIASIKNRRRKKRIV
jgi:uncharacterized membrane protein YcaP (DUF421 family)